MSLKLLTPEHSHLALFLSIGMSPENVGKKFKRSPQAIRQLMKDPLFKRQVDEFIDEISGKIISQHVKVLNKVQDLLEEAIEVQAGNMRQTKNLTERGKASERLYKLAGLKEPPEQDVNKVNIPHLQIIDSKYEGVIDGVPEGDAELLHSSAKEEIGV